MKKPACAGFFKYSERPYQAATARTGCRRVGWAA